MPKKHRYVRHSTLPRSLRGKALDMLPKKAPAIKAEDLATPKAAPPGMSPTEHSLQQKIIKFTYQERFQRDFQRALTLFFGPQVLQTRRLEAEETATIAFQVWFMNDYVTYEGQRIIEIFAQEVGATLPPAEAQMLDDWRHGDCYRLIEVLEVHPGVGVTVQDLLNDEVL